MESCGRMGLVKISTLPAKAFMSFRPLCACTAFLILITACGEPEPPLITKTMEVTATAYNSHRGQTQGDPFQTAFGDTLSPGLKAIAVSRDLLDSGLVHNSEVWIEGLGGPYCVVDKMNRRWRKHIDIYMGNSRDSAREWGRRKVKITWKEWAPKEKDK